MPVSQVFFKEMARAVLHGFMGNPRIMNMLTMYRDLQQRPGTNAVDVPVWSSFTIRTMGGSCSTPCGENRTCDDPQATLLTIELITRFVPTAICLADLNIMSDSQLAGMIAKVIQDLVLDFEVGTASSIWDTLFTDAVFNGAAASMAPVVLGDNAAGYRALSIAISKARAKDSGAGVSFIVPPDLDGFIRSIPDRDISLMIASTRYEVVGNAAAFVGNYGGLQTGKIGYIYPTDALAYAAPNINQPNVDLQGGVGNMWTTMLDDTTIPGKMLYFAHQYGLRVVREGDIQMIIAP